MIATSICAPLPPEPTRQTTPPAAWIVCWRFTPSASAAPSAGRASSTRPGNSDRAPLGRVGLALQHAARGQVERAVGGPGYRPPVRSPRARPPCPGVPRGRPGRPPRAWRSASRRAPASRAQRRRHRLGRVARPLRPHADLVVVLVRAVRLQGASIARELAPVLPHQRAAAPRRPAARPRRSARGLRAASTRRSSRSTKRALRSAVISAARAAERRCSRASNSGSRSWLEVTRLLVQALQQHVEVAHLAERRAEPLQLVAQRLGPLRVDQRLEGPQVAAQPPGARRASGAAPRRRRAACAGR